MLKPDFLRLIRRLCVNYDRKPLHDAKSDLWFEKVRDYSERQLARAVEAIIEHQERFPALNILLAALNYQAAIDAQEREIREVDYARERFYEHPPNPEYVKRAMQICHEAPRRSQERHHEAMLEMDLKWPGRGWKGEAEECKRRRNLMNAAKRCEEAESIGELVQEAEMLPF